MIDTNGSSAPAAAAPAYGGGSVRIPGHIVRPRPDGGAEPLDAVLDALPPLGSGAGGRDAAARAPAAPAHVVPAVPIDPFALPVEDIA